MAKNQDFDWLDAELAALPRLPVPEGPEEETRQEVRVSDLQKRILHLARLNPEQIIRRTRGRFDRE